MTLTLIGSTKSLVGIAGTETKIQPPLSVPFKPNSKPCQYDTTIPRSRTRSELYSADVKLQSLAANGTVNYEPCPSNVLALCPVPGQGIYGEMLTLTGTGVNSTTRDYFGPVDLQKNPC